MIQRVGSRKCPGVNHPRSQVGVGRERKGVAMVTALTPNSVARNNGDANHTCSLRYELNCVLFTKSLRIFAFHHRKQHVNIVDFSFETI